MARISKEQLISLQKKLKTDAKIGEKFGITRQAVHQLRKKYNVSSVIAKNAERNNEIISLYHAGKSGTDIARKTGLSVSQTYRIINESIKGGSKMAVKKKTASKKGVKKAAAKKPVKKKAAAKKTTKKAVKKTAKKKPAAKKTVKKATKKIPKKVAKKTTKKAPKKAAKKTVKKTVKKAAKKAVKKIAKKTAARKKPAKKSRKR